MSSLHANWNDKIHAFSISELGVAGNLSMGDFFQATDESFGHLELIRNLTIDENTVILAVIGEDKQLKLLHHPTDFGGKLTRKENKVVALEGLSTKAIIGLLDANKLTAPQAKQAPDAEKLMECTTKEEIGELTTNQLNRSNFLPFILLPPLIITHLLEADLSEPLSLIPQLVSVARKWDEDHEEDEEITLKATPSIAPLLRWLFVAGKGKFDGVSLNSDESDEEMKAYLRILTKAHLVPPPSSDSNPRSPQRDATPNTMLVKVLSRIGENLEESLDYKKKDHEREEAKKERINKAHDSFRHMLRMAGSTDGELPADDITPDAKKFFNAETRGLADQTLNQFFDEDKLTNVGFASGLTDNLYNFNLLWNNNVYPGNNSIFSFTSTSVGDTQQKGRFLLMHLQDKTGAGMKSEDDIKKMIKQSVYVPTTVDGMIKALKRYKTSIRVFYGGKLLEAWNILIPLVEEQEDAFVARAVGDEKFVASFLYRVDKRIQEFLLDCRRLSDREFVNDRMIEFGHIVDDVRMGQFHTYLPPNFFFSDAESKKRKSDQLDDESTPVPAPVPSGGGGKGGKDSKKKIENKGPLPALQLSNEEFQKVKGNMAILTLRPKWGNKAMCHRFHSFGHCYGSCGNAASHVDSNKVEEAKRAEYEEWVKEARKLN